MSGGTFEGQSFTVADLADEIEWYIDAKEYAHLSEETQKKFRIAVRTLRLGAMMARRIEWLLSGDDNEETFHKRLNEDMEELLLSEGMELPDAL